MLRHGIVGYGAGGRWFHAPYVVAAEGIELVGVVTRSPERADLVRAELPGVSVHASLAALVAAGVESVTITTPPATRHDLVLEALDAGLAVVADKPFAPSGTAGRALVAAASTRGRPLTVFHNRRWDSDFRTVQRVVREGRVGRVWSVESRFELDEPGSLDGGPDGGLLRDLGAHLVDQAVILLGTVATVRAQWDLVETAEGPTDAFFDLELRHTGGVRSRLVAGKVNHTVAREWRVYGSSGAYLASGTDVQTRAILTGRRPTQGDPTWGREDEALWGTLHSPDGDERVPSERGAYQDFYTAFAAAVRGDGELPVSTDGALHVLDVLDAARVAAGSGDAEPVAG